MREISPNRILLVDDDPSVREFLSRRLEEEGFETLEATDGIDGLMKLRNELPGAIISDLQMPRMSGFEFVSVVRRRFPFIPVIVLSGSFPKEDVSEDVEPDVWLKKGELNFAELIETLRDLVRTRPHDIELPQIVKTPVRTRPGSAGYVFLTCPDCLRTFRAMCPPGNKTVELTAVCTHCEPRVPFLMESSATA